MLFTVDGRRVFAAGRLAPGAPLVLFLHGAGMDHSVWALQSRWLAGRGRGVAALDFPGHGRSEGPLLPDIAAMADWTARVIDACGAARATLVGHSMGGLVALDCALRHPDRVAALALVGTAARMAVHPDMIASARGDAREAIAMVSLWGLGPAATQGGAPAPGVWMLGAVRRLLERAAPGVLANDLVACDAFGDAAPRAGRIACPTLVLAGGRDMMAPARGGRALAAAIPEARFEQIPEAGHMMMMDRADETRASLARHIPD